MSKVHQWLVGARAKGGVLAVGAAGVVALLASCTPISDVARVSLDGSGGQVAGDSAGASLTDDGRYVVFSSAAPQFPGANGKRQIYRKDRTTQAVVLVSATAAGTGANGDSDAPSIAGDGSRVAWHSRATDLRPDVDATANTDVYAQDLDTAGRVGQPLLVSAGPGGSAGTGNSTKPATTADGDTIVFESSDLSIGGVITPVDEALYLWEEGTAGLEYLSDGNLVNLGGGHPFLTQQSTTWLNNRTCGGGDIKRLRDVGVSRQPISDDGRYVVFTAGWCGLGALGSSKCFGTYYTAAHFVYDRQGAGQPITPIADCQIALLAGHQYGTASSGNISPPAISPDGTTVVSPMGVGALVHTPSMSQIGGLPIEHGNSFTDVDVSVGGEKISFLTSTALVATDTNGVVDSYLAGGTVVRSSSLNATIPDRRTVDAQLSRSGNRVAFTSEATNIVSDDTNGRRDVFTAQVGAMGSAASIAYSDPALLAAILPAERRGCNPLAAFIALCTGKAADPIDTFTGNYHQPYTDLLVPGRGGGMGVTRGYNSDAAAIAGVFGPGWSSNLDMQLVFEANGIVTVRQESGAESRFLKYGGGYVAAKRTFGTLTPTTGGSLVLKRSDRSTATFSATGRLLSQADPNGFALTYAYSGPSDRLATVTDHTGRVLQVAWTGDRITQIEDPAGRTVSYGYDAAGDLRTVTDLGGGEWRYEYDAGHRLTKAISPRQVADGSMQGVVNQYDASGRVIRQVDEEGRTHLFDYTSVPGATAVTDPAGEVRLDRYADGVRTSVTEGHGTPAAATWAFEYHPTFKGITRVTDPNGHLDQLIAYDDHGNVSATTDALDRTSRFTYNRDRRLVTSTDPTGLTTTYTYDGSGNTASVATPIAETGGTRTVTYTRSTDAATRGDLLRVRNALGREWTMTYDAVTGITASVRDPLGNTSTQAHDAVGRLQWSVAPKGNVTGADPDAFKTTYTTDAFGRVTGVSDPLGNSSTVTFDPNGNPLTTTDALGQSTTYVYDETDLPVGVTNADGTTESTVYDAEGQVAQTVDRAGRATTYQRDPLDRTTSVVTSDGRTTSFAHDPAGNVTRVQLPGGNCAATPRTGCVTNSYDVADQLTGVDYSDPATPDVAMTYDGRGSLATFADGTGTTTYTHDSLGRMTGAVDGAGSSTGYQWDAEGNLTGLVYPDAKLVRKAYDTAGRLSTVTDWTGKVYRYAYDPNGNVTTLTHPQNVTAYTYDNADRLDTQTFRRGTVVLGSIDHDFGDTGLLDAAVTADLPAGPTAFEYDELDQLVGSGPDDYAYDLAGNPITLADGTRQVFDAANQLCFTAPSTVTGGSCGTPPAGSTRYGYGPRGQRGGKLAPGGAGTLYAFDEADRLTAVHHSSDPSTSYTYDARGLRQSRTSDGSTDRATWTHNGLPLLLTEATDTAAPTRWVYGAGTTPLAQYDPDGTLRYLHPDHLGSVRMTTNSSGNVLAKTTWDAYGNEVDATAPSGTPFGYAGGYTDDETGFIYLRARYYDPETAQFVSRDPLEVMTGSAYGYIDNSPVNGTDPTGLAPWDGMCINNPFDPDDGCDSIAEQHPEASQTVANVAGGTLEAISFGASNRSEFLSSRVDPCSGAYGAGLVLGTALDFAIGSHGAGSGSRVVRACSFEGSTLVLMADGSRKAIEDVEVGDLVLATNPETGESGPREVREVFVHEDTVYDLSLGGEEVVTTEDHPFWNDTDRQWQRADELDAGDRVLAADGDLVVVDGFDPGSARIARAYNLAVDELNTFHVAVGNEDILVHNVCQGAFRSGLLREYGLDAQRASGLEAHHIIPKGHRYAKRARGILGDTIIHDPALNGVLLRRGPGALHNATLTRRYVEAVDQAIYDAFKAGGLPAARARLAEMRDVLIFLQSMAP